MDSSKSFLSARGYGYSFVVAVTQQSVNSLLKSHLSKLHMPAFQSYAYIQDGSELHGDSDPSGINPFEIKNGTDVNDEKIQKLAECGFARGFRAQLGVPSMTDHSKTPDVVELDSEPYKVTFSLLCSHFAVVELLNGKKWVNVSQELDKPLVFRAYVYMTPSKVEQDAYQHLPPDVQSRIKNMGGSAFSVYQLLFDLSGGSQPADPLPQIPVSENTYSFLETYFYHYYFEYLAAPPLACIVKEGPPPTPTLKLTRFELNTSPYVDSHGNPVENPDDDQKAASTLNYLCAADGAYLPPAARVNWNWVPTDQLDDHDGAIAINRDSLASYIEAQVTPYVRSNCIDPVPTVTWDPPFKIDYGYKIKELDESIPINFERPSSGSTVLSFEWNRDNTDSAGLLGLYSMQMAVSYSMEVEFTRSKITIKQTLVFYLNVGKDGKSRGCNIMDNTFIDTFTLGVNDYGKITAAKKSYGEIILSVDGDSKDVFDKVLGVNALFSSLTAKLQPKLDDMQDIPVSIISDYVFPGGRTFIFKNPQFSEHQDLVAAITYTE